ncbi:hypothetical protein DFQ27_008329 [Actinomortierella ambigua]|uniref:C2H2-type domain-containing protein n=1 Tax=Actinomortierella ambigua TaxID=1343610 RepID=A0A9P6PRH5_9FUNG|nr:hypothetical protein DFQ27_008329 [Actinomortierella ambigua]
MVSAFKSESSTKDAQHRPLDTQGLSDAHKPSLQLKGGGSDPGAGLTSVLPSSQQPDAAGLPMHHHRPSLPPSPSQSGGYYHQSGGQAPLSAPTSPSMQAASIYPSMSASGAAAGGAEPPRRNSVPILSSSGDRKRVPSGEGPVDYHGFRAGPTPPGYNTHSAHGSSQSYSSWGGPHSQTHPDQYYYREERSHPSMPQHTGYYHVGGPIEYRGVHEDAGAPAPPPPSASHIDHHNTYPYASSSSGGNEYPAYPPSSSSTSTSSSSSSSSSSSHGGGATLHRHNSLPTGSSLSHLSHQHLGHHHHHSHHPTSHLPHSHHHSQHHPPLLPQTSQPSQQSQQSQPHHQQANKHPCKFPNCGWSFKRFEHLKRHMLVHTKERPFVCDFQGCEKSFSRSDNFSAHLRTHTKKTQQMRRFDRPLVDGLGSFRGAVGMGMSGGLPMGVGDHTHHRHSIAGYPPSYAGARSPLEGPIDPYAQGRACNSYCGPSDIEFSYDQNRPTASSSLPPPSHQNQHQHGGSSSSSMHPLDSPVTPDSPNSIVPRFNTIKLDLKAVSNNPEDVHLHNLHNQPLPPSRSGSTISNSLPSSSSSHLGSYNSNSNRHNNTELPNFRSSDDTSIAGGSIERSSSSSPPPLGEHRARAGRGQEDDSYHHSHPPPSIIHYQDHENPNPNGESPILTPISPPSSSRPMSAHSFSVGIASHFTPVGSTPINRTDSPDALEIMDPHGYPPPHRHRHHNHGHTPMDSSSASGPGSSFHATSWTEASPSSPSLYSDGYSSTAMRTDDNHFERREYHLQQLQHHYSDAGGESYGELTPKDHRRSSMVYPHRLNVSSTSGGNSGGGAYEHQHSLPAGGMIPEDPLSSSNQSHHRHHHHHHHHVSRPPMMPQSNNDDLPGGGSGGNHQRHRSMSSSSSSTSLSDMDSSPTTAQMNLMLPIAHRLGAGSAEGSGGGGSLAGARPRGPSMAMKNHCCTVPGCHKRFKRLEHLKRHIKTHTLERPFHCSALGCNKRFSRSDNLSQHIKTHQRHIMNKVYWKHRPL